MAGKLEQGSKCIWFTGLSGSGKTTLANALKQHLDSLSVSSVVLDGDMIRQALNKDIGFSEEDRKENIRRVAEIAKIILKSKVLVICAFMSPTDDIRSLARNILGNYYFEVFVDTPIEVCIARDVKGIYKKAIAGKIKNLSGFNAPFESPVNPDLVITTENTKPQQSILPILELFG